MERSDLQQPGYLVVRVPVIVADAGNRPSPGDITTAVAEGPGPRGAACLPARDSAVTKAIGDLLPLSRDGPELPRRSGRRFPFPARAGTDPAPGGAEQPASRACGDGPGSSTTVIVANGCSSCSRG